MNEPNFTEIFYNLDELFHDDSSLILLQKSIAFHILKQITLAQILCNNVKMSPGIENLMQFKNIWMMTKLQNVTF